MSNGDTSNKPAEPQQPTDQPALESPTEPAVGSDTSEMAAIVRLKQPTHIDVALGDDFVNSGDTTGLETMFFGKTAGQTDEHGYEEHSKPGVIQRAKTMRASHLLVDFSEVEKPSSEAVAKLAEINKLTKSAGITLVALNVGHNAEAALGRSKAAQEITTAKGTPDEYMARLAEKSK